MYGNNFQPAESLKAMTYFQGGDLSLLSTEEKRILIRFASSVRELPTIARTANELAVTA